VTNTRIKTVQIVRCFYRRSQFTVANYRKKYCQKTQKHSVSNPALDVNWTLNVTVDTTKKEFCDLEMQQCRWRLYGTLRYALRTVWNTRQQQNTVYDTYDLISTAVKRYTVNNTISNVRCTLYFLRSTQLSIQPFLPTCDHLTNTLFIL